MMKKILALLLSAAVVLGVVGCGGGSDKTTDGVTKYRIYISATEVELEENETFVLVASYGDKKVNFSSADTSVATVTEDGTITAVATGETEITVGCEGNTKVCKVTVVRRDRRIVIDCKSEITAVGSLTKRFTAKVYEDGNETDDVVIWTVSPASAGLTYDGNAAVLKINGEGEYTLTASYKTASATVRIRIINVGSAE